MSLLKSRFGAKKEEEKKPEPKKEPPMEIPKPKIEMIEESMKKIEAVMPEWKRAKK